MTKRSQIKSIQVKSNISKKSHWQSINEIPPSNRLQKINIWVTVFFTIVTTALAIFAFLTATEIKGMSELLEKTNILSRQNGELLQKLSEQSVIMDKSFKPLLRGFGYNIEKGEKDTINYRTTIKNYGGRAAIDIICRLWFMSDSVVYETGYAKLPYLAPEESLPWIQLIDKRKFPPELIARSKMVLKITFKDDLNRKSDSAYFFGQHYGIKNGTLYTTPLSKVEEDRVRSEIKANRPDF